MSFTHAGQYTEALIGLASGNYTLALVSLPVHVYTVGTTTAVTLYTDRTKGTTASNPATTDASGNLTFFADPGQYDIVFTPPGGTAQRVTVSVLVDPADSGGSSTSLVDKGNWATSTAYVVGDVVTQSGLRYIAQKAHTSGTFATDLAAADWTPLTLAASNQVSKAIAYTAAYGDVVLVDCSQRITNDGVTTSGSPTVTSATANFTSADVGKIITVAAALPANTKISTINSTTSVAVSANATASVSSAALGVGGPVTITLPAVAASQLPIVVKKLDASNNAVMISPASGTIDGASSTTLVNPNETLKLTSDGTNWYGV